MANPLAAFLASLGQSASTIGTNMQTQQLQTQRDEERSARNEQALMRAIFIRMGINPDTGEEIPGFLEALERVSGARRKKDTGDGAVTNPNRYAIRNDPANASSIGGGGFMDRIRGLFQ